MCLCVCQPQPMINATLVGLDYSSGTRCDTPPRCQPCPTLFSTPQHWSCGRERPGVWDAFFSLGISRPQNGDSTSKMWTKSQQEYGLRVDAIMWISFSSGVHREGEGKFTGMCTHQSRVLRFPTRSEIPKVEMEPNKSAPGWGISYWIILSPWCSKYFRNDPSDQCLRRSNWICQIILTTKMKKNAQKRGCI